jgi:hypothetical protein
MPVAPCNVDCEAHADGVHLSGPRQHEHTVEAVPTKQPAPSGTVRAGDLGTCQHVTIASKVESIHDAMMPSHGSTETICRIGHDLRRSSAARHVRVVGLPRHRATCVRSVQLVTVDQIPATSG